MKLQKITQHKYLAAAVGIGLATVTQLTISANAHAVFTNVIVRFDRMQQNTTSTGMICATPATAGTVAKILFTLPTGYTASPTVGNWAVTTTNAGWPSGATAWPGIGTASSVSGQVVTFPSNTLTTGTLYCFNWSNSNAVTTGATGNNYAGSLETQTSGSASVDKSTYTTATIANDQILVTASVPQSFAFSLSANTDALSTLSTSSVTASPTPRVARVDTNAKNGWSIWAKDSTSPSGGLSSPSASYTIGSTTPGTNSTLSSGTEGYNTGVVSSNGTGSGVVSVATPFVGGTSRGGGLNNTYQILGTSTGPNANGTLTLTNNVAISALTPAATDYNDTITVVGAGLF